MLDGGSGGGGDPAEHWSAGLLQLPYGRLLVGAVGLGVIGYAGYQFHRAASAKKVRKHLDLGEAGPTQATCIIRLGRFGIAARAVIFAIAGIFLVRAAMQSDARQAAGFVESLRAVASADSGALLPGAIAFGLIAYRNYKLATARDRHLRGVG
jgi:hypothetical protein